MVEMLLRRRMLMAMSNGGGESDLLYSLYDYTAAAGTSIDTGIAPFQQGMNCTIACDITTNSNPTTSGAAGAAYKLFRVYNDEASESVIAVGKSARNDNFVNAWWMNVSSAYGSKTAAAGRKRILVTHAADSNDVALYSKFGTGSVGTKNLTQTFVHTDGNVFIGSRNEAATTQKLPSSTIHKFEVYNRIWTQAEIDAFFA